MLDNLKTFQVYVEQQIHCNYQLFFMKKLWINNTPGKDRNADQIFHFSQEVPKYLNGYYRISKMDAIKFAALLYRIQCDSDSSVLRNQQQFQSVLPQLLPEDTIKLAKTEDWRKSIMSMYNSQIGLIRLNAHIVCKILFNFFFLGNRVRYNGRQN